MQTITAIGHLGKDPEERITATGKKMTTFSLAISVGKDNTVWYDCTIWDDKLPMFSGILQYLKKGSKVMVIGDLGAPETYQNKSNETKVKLRISPFALKFLPSTEKKEEPTKKSDWDSLDNETDLF